jgi:hypothetical protein
MRLILVFFFFSCIAKNNDEPPTPPCLLQLKKKTKKTHKPKRKQCVATPLWPSVGVKPNTPKVGDLESSGTPECLEFDIKAQNTSH